MPFTALFLFLFYTTDSTINPVPLSIKETTPFKWSNYEAPVSQKLKDSCLNTFKNFYSELTGEKATTLPKNFTDSFHFIDLNGDNRIDIIYQGWSGGEGTVVNFYLNTSNGFKHVFSDHMHLLELNFKRKRLSSFVIYNQGCCAEVVEFERHYSVSPAFDCKLESQSAVLQGMLDENRKIPLDSFFEKSFQFQTLNENYALRYNPFISDKPLPVIEEALPNNTRAHGNIISFYPKGALGTALAHKTDNTGREWWLVAMEPLKYLSYDAYYSLDDFPTYYIGWMSSRFVKRL